MDDIKYLAVTRGEDGAPEPNGPFDTLDDLADWVEDNCCDGEIVVVLELRRIH